MSHDWSYYLGGGKGPMTEGDGGDPPSITVSLIGIGLALLWLWWLVR